MIATTTPRAVALLRRLIANDEVMTTRGTTFDNKANLPPSFIRSVRREYGKSLLGRQELDGELIEEIEGALWTRAMLELCREYSAAPRWSGW